MNGSGAGARCMSGTQSKMAAVAAVDRDLDQCLERGTRRAQTLLDKLQFSEARSVYGDVLRQCAAQSLDGAATGTCRRALVAAVSGLAESFARQSRTQPYTCDNDQHDALPWLRLNIQVLLDRAYFSTRRYDNLYSPSATGREILSTK